MRRFNVAMIIAFFPVIVFGQGGELIQSCLGDEPAELRAMLNVRVMSKTGGEQRYVYHYTRRRLNDESDIYAVTELNPKETGVGYRLTHFKAVSGKSPERSLQATSDEADEHSYWWLRDFDLTVLTPTGSYQVDIASQNPMAGKQYITLNRRSMLSEARFPRSQLSLSQEADGGLCTLLRMAYFGENAKARKKLFFHWQNVKGLKVLESVHLEDAKTLDRVVYKFSKVSVADAQK